MNRLRFLLAALAATIASVALCNTHRQGGTPPMRPKLVVAIVVDQLRTDYIDYLDYLMRPDGLRRLTSEGAYMRDVEFKPLRLDPASATSMLMTGAYPCDTGIPSAMRWNPASLKSGSAFADSNTVGVNTPDCLSPANLRLSTLADEVMIDGAGLSAIYSIAASPAMAIPLAGHAATGATWLNTADGRWATSSYYKELPTPAANRNFRSPLSKRIDTIQWRPLLPIDRYPGLPAQKRQYEFRHTFPSRLKEVYEQFAASPKGNDEVTTLAIEFIKSLNLGRRGDTIDMLCLGYTAAPFRAVRDGDFRAELQDCYLRLDDSIARLLKAIDSTVGLSNCVIMLTGTGYYDDAAAPDAKYRIPGGDFSTKRAIALLNGWFSAKYGPGNYVDTFADYGFHLNLKALENKNVNMAEATAGAREFLTKMSGVDDVFTLSDLLNPRNDDTRRLSLSIDPRTAPELTLTLSPGWNLVQDHTFPEITTPIRRGAIASPAIIFAPGRVNPSKINTPVEATALAPTLTQLLHLRAPNGAASRPLQLP